MLCRNRFVASFLTRRSSLFQPWHFQCLVTCTYTRYQRQSLHRASWPRHPFSPPYTSAHAGAHLGDELRVDLGHRGGHDFLGLRRGRHRGGRLRLGRRPEARARSGDSRSLSSCGCNAWPGRNRSGGHTHPAPRVPRETWEGGWALTRKRN